MKFDTVELDAPITKEHSADHWRERAEFLEEWVCELLRKNQTLRMSRENDQRQHHEETILTFSPLSLDQSHLPSGPVPFRTRSFRVDLGTQLSCPRKECGEIRESVILHRAVNGPAPEASS